MIAEALSVATFWLLLALPGYAVLRRHGQSWLDGAGPLDGYALSCLASLALLTPVSVAGYLFGLPLWVLSASVVLSVIAAAVHLVRARAWRVQSPRPSLVAILALAIIVADAVVGLRLGGHLAGDALHHAGRVRMLLSYGFNSLDPLVEGRVDPIYQGSLYHALIAAAAQLSGLQATHAWAYTLFWAKLATAGALAHLAWTVLRERALAWIAAVAFAVYMAPYSILLYPNMLAVFGLMPLALAFAVRVQLGEQRGQSIAGLAAVALVSAQTHNLYYAFVCMLVGPPLLALLIRARVRRLPGARELLIALVALALGLPWFAAGALERLKPTPPPEPPAAAVAAAAGAPAGAELFGGAPPVVTAEQEAERYRGFLRLPGDQLMANPAKLLDAMSMEAQLLLALALGMLTRRRSAFLALAGSVLLAYAALYVPPLCTALVEAAGAPWIVRRLSAVFNSLWFAIAPGTLLLLIRERFAPRWLDVIALGLAGAYAYVNGVDGEPWTRDRYLASAASPAELQGRLAEHESRRAFFNRNIPRGATVVTKPSDATKLALDCDCYPLVFAAARGSRGVEGIAVRRWVADMLLEPSLDLPRRVGLLRQYGVTALWIRGGKKLSRIYRPIVTREETSGDYRILVLDPNRDVGAPPFPRTGSR
jgi:hypothetical protein